MVNIVRELFEDGEDSLYLFNPDLVESSILHGDQVCSIGNYTTDGWKSDLSFAFRQTLYVLMAEDLTHRKYLIFITDRLKNSKVIEKAMKINEKEMIDAHFIIVGIGNNYDKNYFRELSKNSNVDYLHLDQPEELNCYLFEEKNGKSESCCETNERCERIQLTSGHNCSISRAVRLVDTTNTEFVQVDEKQLLPVISGGRLFPESRFCDESRDECTEECGSPPPIEHPENC